MKPPLRLLVLLLISGWFFSATAAPPPIPIEKAPAPLFDDPVWHGASDPTVIWLEKRHEWLMYYTQRRATLNPVQGHDWVHGTAIGIASSPDAITWKYEGICQGDHGLGNPIPAGLSWWAPCVYTDDDKTYHLFVACVEGGLHTDWGGNAGIQHFTSTDGLNWKYLSTADLKTTRCIDACVAKINSRYYMWYKDERQKSNIFEASSNDLDHWKVEGDAIPGKSQEAPLVWQWRGQYWMITDPWIGLRIYNSPDGLSGWKENTVILNQPGKRPKDNSKADHPFVLVQGNRAFIYYFVGFQPPDPVYKRRQSVIQLAELKLDANGIVTCNRDQTSSAP